MNVKRYIAADEAEAMDKVRAELGRDAFLLNTRKIRRKGLTGLFRHPLVEVVAAYEPPESAAPAQPFALMQPVMPTQPVSPAAFAQAVTPAQPIVPAQPLASSSSPAYRTLSAAPGFMPLPLRDALTGEEVLSVPQSGKIQALETKIDGITAALGALAGKIQMGRGDYFKPQFPPEVERLLLSLTENEVHEEFVRKIGREVADVTEREQAAAAEVMEQILKQHIGEAAPIKLKKYKRTVAVFLGPTGVGKTTTVAKLAHIYAHHHHARVGVITADTSRVAAVEQMETYAEILQVPFTVVYKPEELADALQGFEQCDLVLIDTAGRSPSDPALEPEVLSLIRTAEVDEAHLVLSAATGFAGCLHILKSYAFLRDFKLLFTKLDETPTWGAVLNLRFLTDRLISYMADGQTVPATSG